MGLFREKPDNFVEFHHQAKDIAALKEAVSRQLELNKVLLPYVEATISYMNADISATWMSSAKDLAKTAKDLADSLRESMK